jgi:hypothetical protein
MGRLSEWSRLESRVLIVEFIVVSRDMEASGVRGERVVKRWKSGTLHARDDVEVGDRNWNFATGAPSESDNGNCSRMPFVSMCPRAVNVMRQACGCCVVVLIGSAFLKIPSRVVPVQYARRHSSIMPGVCRWYYLLRCW